MYMLSVRAMEMCFGRFLSPIERFARVTMIKEFWWSISEYIYGEKVLIGGGIDLDGTMYCSNSS